METDQVTVDMIVAVHDPRRDVHRAVASILADPDPTIRALVVAHNLPAAEVRALLEPLTHAHPQRIRIEVCDDGVPSPSGPFNHGLAVSDADFVGIMGSDDELDPGAIAQWRRVALRLRADAVIATVVRGPQRDIVRSPPKRLWRTGVLDFARDRLPYRSAPLGLMRRSAVADLGLRLLDGARNGGDLPFATRLWFLGRVVSSPGPAAYVEHADAPVRVTLVAKPASEELGPVLTLLEDPLLSAMTRAQREALATKLVRRNVTDSLRKRRGGLGLTPDDIRALCDVVAAIEAFAPRTLDLMSVAQRRVIDALCEPGTDPERIAELDRAAQRYATPGALLPARLRHVLHPQGPLRFTIASALVPLGMSRWFAAGRLAAVAASAAAAAMGGLLVGRALAGPRR